MNSLDKKIVSVLQEDFPIVSNPYQQLAAEIGITEEKLLDKVKEYQQKKIIRKMGAVLRHQKVGYTANALCVFVVDEDDVASAGQLMAKYPQISHCYTRITYEGWPYNLYAMVHGYSKDSCQAVADELATKLSVVDYQLLFSIREWKKTNMQYFVK